MPLQKQQFEQYVRHQAFQTVAALPQDPEVALRILDIARSLLLEGIERTDSTIHNLKVITGD
jgi:hypothetical protein